MPRKPKITPVDQAQKAQAVMTPSKAVNKDSMDLLIERVRVHMVVHNRSLDEALRAEGYSRSSIPVYVYKKILRDSIGVKRELFNIPADERAAYIRAADFETYMKAVESGDAQTQLAFSKMLRQDNELGLEAKTPTLMVNVGALKDLFSNDQEYTGSIINVNPEPVDSESVKIKER
jgi:hypothetical protein